MFVVTKPKDAEELNGLLHVIEKFILWIAESANTNLEV